MGGGNFRVNKFCPTQIDFGLESILNGMESRCLFLFAFFWSSFQHHNHKF
jgi:hypothetical protein